MERHRLLVFGATGAIGGAICSRAVSLGWDVTGVSRKGPEQPISGVLGHAYDPLADEFDGSPLSGAEPFHAVCWAQGMNTNDSILDADADKHMELYRANCLYIIVSLQALLRSGRLAASSRLCVISSIWQQLARQSKLSYCMSKAALQGLVLSASADLASQGHLINAVLPGALDTPMTRQNLTAPQIERLLGGTGFERLSTLSDVASVVTYLCSPENTGITGQFIAADLGWSRVRIV